MAGHYLNNKKSKPSKPERDNWYHLVLFIKGVSGEEVLSGSFSYPLLKECSLLKLTLEINLKLTNVYSCSTKNTRNDGNM